MAYPDNLLVHGERVIVNKRPHWKVLILPTILFIVIIGAGAALAAWISGRNWENASWAYYAIIAVAVIALIVVVLVPFLRWRTEHFVITNHHVFFRSGLLSRREHQIPLGQIANMETEVTFWGRLMGYGSLIVESSADQPLKFRNVASLSKVQAQLNQLIRDESERTQRGPDERRDTPPGGYPPQGYPPPGYQRNHQQPGYQQGYPAPGQQQGYPPQGYQPTQAYPQPPGYPPPGTQGGYPPPAQRPTVAGPNPAGSNPGSPPPGSAAGEGRPAQRS